METITEQIPEALLYEEFGGRKYYRRGYREVLLGLKYESEIMGSSFLQALIIQALVHYLKTILPKKTYWVPTNEAGLHLALNENLANDIAIVEKDKAHNPLSLKYSDVPPKFVIEVDIKIDPKDYDAEPAAGSDMDYVIQKSQLMLDFGVEGVVWIMTRSRKVVLLRPQVGMQLFEWTDYVPIFDGHTFCLQTILEEDDILPPST